MMSAFLIQSGGTRLEKQPMRRIGYRKPLCYLYFLLLLLLFLFYRLKTTTDFLDTLSSKGTEHLKYAAKHNIPVSGRFQKDWCVMERTRRDWKQVLRACASNMSWRESNPSNDSLTTDPDKSYIAVWDVRPAGQFSRLSIRSQTKKGATKLTGGDAWRVHLHGPSLIAPTVIDHNNGSYEIVFVAMVPGKYVAQIMLDYSLCDGFRDPPIDWFIKGNAQGKNQPQGILGRDDPYILKPLWGGSPIYITIPPPSGATGASAKTSFSYSDQQFDRSCGLRCNHIWNGFGAWTKNTWTPHFQEKPRYKLPHNREGILWFYGDSAAKKLYTAFRNTPLCKTMFKHCHYSYSWVYQMENYNLTLQKYIKENLEHAKTRVDNLDFNVSRVLNEISQVLYHPEMDCKSIIIFNCGLHFVENTNFSNYQQLIDGIINLLRVTEVAQDGSSEIKRFKGNFIWKTTTAINRQKYSAKHLHSRRFRTYQRVLLYNAYATDAMCNAGVDVLDVYPLTDAYPGGTGSAQFPYDPVHYVDSVFKPIEQLLEQLFS